MKILYIARVPDSLTGVSNKIKDTIKAWHESGNQSCMYNSTKLDNRLKVQKYTFLELLKNKFSIYIYDRNLNNKLKKYNPDVVYWRFGPVPLLQRFKKNVIILESNTNLKIEMKSRSLLSQLMIMLYIVKFNSICKGVIGVTPESLTFFKHIPYKAIIGNGIDLNHNIFTESIKHKIESKVRKKAIFIGSPGCIWHGIDKILDIADYFPMIDFHVIGYDEEKIKDTYGKLPPNLNVKGYLEGEALHNELINADIAIGSLAMQRAGMKHSSSLKNRLYLQYGLPVLLQGEDLDLLNCPGVFSLPEAFAKSDIKLLIEEALRYTLENKDYNSIEALIDSKNVESRRIEFFKQCI